MEENTKAAQLAIISLTPVRFHIKAEWGSAFLACENVGIMILLYEFMRQLGYLPRNNRNHNIDHMLDDLDDILPNKDANGSFIP